MEEYITIAEAARKLGDVSDKTIRRAIHSGKLAARYPQPNKAEISIADLQEWYTSRYVRPGETQDKLEALEAQYTKLLNLWQETRAAMDNIDLLQENLKFEVTTQLNKFATLLKEQDELIEKLTARVKLLEEQLQAKKAPRQHKTSIALPDDFVWLSDFCAQHFVPYQAAEELFPIICQIIWFLRNFADLNGGMLKVCPVFHPPRFLETIHWLGLPIFVLVFPLQSVFTLIEDSNLEKIELCATIHAFFNEL